MTEKKAALAFFVFFLESTKQKRRGSLQHKTKLQNIMLWPPQKRSLIYLIRRHFLERKTYILEKKVKFRHISSFSII